MASKRTIVVLEIIDDEPARAWWDAVGVPDPAEWNQHVDGYVPARPVFPPNANVYVSVHVSEAVA